MQKVCFACWVLQQWFLQANIAPQLQATDTLLPYLYTFVAQRLKHSI
jgi:hypothetical protein